MSGLDLSLLQKVKPKGGKTIAQCPACASAGSDKKGEHLVIYPSGGYSCIAHKDDRAHLKEIFAMVGIKSERAEESKGRNQKKQERVHSYHDADGNHVFDVVVYRLSNGRKDIRQRRPDGKGGFIWNLQGIVCVLYHLPQLLSSGGPVWIVEGEKDVESLEAREVTATCNPMGAGKWRDSYNEPLRDRDVILAPDNDKAGREHVESVAKSLEGVAASVRVVNWAAVWPTMPEKADITDALKDGTRIEDIGAVAEPWEPSQSLPDQENQGDPLAPFYYTGAGYLVDVGQEFIPIQTRSLRHRLKGLKLPASLNDALCAIEDTHYVCYAGPLAGVDKGLHVSAEGVKLLATTSPMVIESRQGEHPTINKFLADLFDDQLPYFMGWMKCARSAMLNRKATPAHVLGLAGAAGCGKTQLIGRIIVPGMGGRRANPRSYFIGGTFNADLLGAEMLILDDEDIPKKEAQRQSLKQRVKNFLYSEAPRFECKHRDAFSYQGVWRCVVACNFAEDDLRALPPIDNGTRDKLMYLKCGDAFPDQLSDEEFLSWKSRVDAELPAFLSEVENFEIPQDLRAARGMIHGYQHPAILAALDALDGWPVLLDLVDSLKRSGELCLPWEGKAIALETILMASMATKHNAQKLLGAWAAKCGVLLTEAALKSNRVDVKSTHAGTKSYRISP